MKALIVIMFVVVAFICGFFVGKRAEIDREQKELMQNERAYPMYKTDSVGYGGFVYSNPNDVQKPIVLFDMSSMHPPAGSCPDIFSGEDPSRPND